MVRAMVRESGGVINIELEIDKRSTKLDVDERILIRVQVLDKIHDAHRVKVHLCE